MIQEHIPPDFQNLDTAFIAGWKAALSYARTFMAEIESPNDEIEQQLSDFSKFLSTLNEEVQGKVQGTE